MKKIIWIYGLIAGLICPLGFVLTTGNNMDFENGMIYGFASMIIAFALIFVATINYKNSIGDGAISFGKAFRIGLFISIIASSMYVAVWLFCLYNYYPDFAVKYGAHYIEGLKAAGASAQKIAAETTKMNEFAESYKNPLVVIAYTYLEILPVGLVLSVISALILKKKPQIAL